MLPVPAHATGCLYPVFSPHQSSSRTLLQDVPDKGRMNKLCPWLPLAEPAGNGYEGITAKREHASGKAQDPS